MAPAAAIGLDNEAIRKMASRRERPRIVQREGSEHLGVDVAPARHQRRHRRHLGALHVCRQGLVQAAQSGGSQPGAAHDTTARWETIGGHASQR